MLGCGDPNPIVIIGRIERDLVNIASISAHNVKIKIPSTIRIKQDQVPIGWPTGGVDQTEIEGQSSLIGPIDAHHIDFLTAIALWNENDPVAIGRPGGTYIAGGSVS